MPCLLIKPSPVQHFILQHQTIVLTPQRPHVSIDLCHFLLRGSLACFQPLQSCIRVLVFGLLSFKMIIGPQQGGFVCILTGPPRQKLWYYFWLCFQQSLEQENSLFPSACQPHDLLAKVDEKSHRHWRADDQLDVVFSCQTAGGTQPI